MAILPIIKDDISILTKKSEEFDFTNPPYDPSQLAHDLVDTMHDKNGLGLAAIQCNIPYQVFVMRGVEQAFALFNPRILSYGKEDVVLEEACLSFPGLVMKIKRPNAVKVRFWGPNGEVQIQEFAGLTARIIQHECLHLRGNLYWEGISKLKMSNAIKKAKKLGYDYEGKGLLKFCS